MEATQALDRGSTDDEDVEDEEGFRSKVVAKLRLLGPDLEGTEMEVRGGENNIGRDPDRCSIPIQAKVRHLVITCLSCHLTEKV